MRWKGGRRSENIDDRRGTRAGGRGVKVGGGAILLIAVVTLLLGGDPTVVLEQLGQNQTTTAPSTGGRDAASDELADFTSVILADTEDVWTQQFAKMGRTYQKPVLVLFTDVVHSACGTNSSAVGPFYCPADFQVYIDLGFYRDLQTNFGAPGDFAQAYVIAHEVGHHVQNILGLSEQVSRLQARASKAQANSLSVRLELHADCLAGVWAHHAQRQRDLLEKGDVEEGLNAAAAIGDDRLQRQAQGYTNPESWTHGSSQQRVRWFRNGLESGDIARCDTFGTDDI